MGSPGVDYSYEVRMALGGWSVAKDTFTALTGPPETGIRGKLAGVILGAATDNDTVARMLNLAQLKGAATVIVDGYAGNEARQRMVRPFWDVWQIVHHPALAEAWLFPM